MMDRIDLRVYVEPVGRVDMAKSELGESSEIIKARVIKAREIAASRFMGMGWSLNSQIPARALRSVFQPERAAMNFLHDELDIPLEAIRVKLGGGDNGHNGLKSIRSAFDDGQWYRIRLGIGRPPGTQDPSAFVLKAFSSTEATSVAVLRDSGADATEALITKGLIETQSQFNS
jgi:PTH1 family peptidyl-tRNA hydrolase